MAGLTVGKIVVESDPTLAKISDQLAELIALLKADKTIHVVTGHEQPAPDISASGWRRPDWAQTGPSAGAV